MDQISAQLLPFPHFQNSLYLFKVVRQKHKVDTAESQLSDNEEEVHNPPAERVRQVQRPSGLGASPERNICAAILAVPSQGVTKRAVARDKVCQCHWYRVWGVPVLSMSPPWFLPLCMSSGHHQSITWLLPSTAHILNSFFFTKATENPWHERLGSKPFSYNSYNCDPRTELVAGQLAEVQQLVMT